MLVALLLVALFFGLGFVIKGLFYVALILALLWVIGFFFRGITGRRWYRW